MKKSHSIEYTFPQYRFWAEALEVGLYTSTDDPPRGQMFDGTKTCKKPSKLKEALTLLPAFFRVMFPSLSNLVYMGHNLVHMFSTV